MVTAEELRAAVAAGRRDCTYDIGPFITLVDGAEFEATWAERRKLVLAQIAGADLVAISRADMLREHKRDEIGDVLKQDSKNIVQLSTLKEFGMEPIMRLVDPDHSQSVQIAVEGRPSKGS